MFKTGHYSNECPDADDNKPTKNKKGSSFQVLNRDQDSSEDEADPTTSHEHLLAVQENRKKMKALMMVLMMILPRMKNPHVMMTQKRMKTTKGLTLCRMRFYVLFQTNQAYQADGYC